MIGHLLNFLWRDDGPTAVEYAVLLALIMLTAITSIAIFGGAAGGSMNDSSTQIQNYMNGSAS